jgi:hypothetical protein
MRGHLPPPAGRPIATREPRSARALLFRSLGGDDRCCGGRRCACRYHRCSGRNGSNLGLYRQRARPQRRALGLEFRVRLVELRHLSKRRSLDRDIRRRADRCLLNPLRHSVSAQSINPSRQACAGRIEEVVRLEPKRPLPSPEQAQRPPVAARAVIKVAKGLSIVSSPEPK